jgi:Zn-dependent protease
MLISLLREAPGLIPILIPGLLLSLTIHEFAHARTADMFGDPTARHMGRCTMNPIAHLDLMGSILILLVGFGWAKPVPVNPNNLNPRRLGDIMVSLAGPLSNLVLGCICLLGLNILLRAQPDGLTQSFMYAPRGMINLMAAAMLWVGIINLNLMVFNMIPLFPLDGHHILREMLPASNQYSFMRWQMHYGRWALLALWIGPAMLGRLSNGPVPDPLGWLMGWTMYGAMHLVSFGS